MSSAKSIIGLDHAGVTVGNLDRAIDFYVGVLGFEPLRRRDGIDLPHIRRLVGFPDAVLNVAMLAVPGGSKLELIEYVAPVGGAEAIPANHKGVIHIAFTVPNIAGVVERLSAAGIAFVSEPQRSPSGPTEGYQFVYCRDPDGAILEFIETARPT